LISAGFFQPLFAHMPHQYATLPARPRARPHASFAPDLFWLGLIIGLERLTYYGTRSVLTLFLVEQLQLPRAQVSPLLTTTDALLCLLPLAGAFVADRYWGLPRARLVGGVVLLLGQLVLTGASLGSALAWPLVCVGLVLQVVGNALLAPALYASAGQLFARDDSRNQLTSFVLLTAFVMAGAFMASMIVIPLASGFGYSVGLGMTAASAAAVVMLLVLLPKADVSATEEFPSPASRPWLGPAAGLMVLAAGSTWWLWRAEPVWMLQLLSAGLVAAALIYCSFRAGLRTLGLLVALMLTDVLTVVLMVLMPSLTYDGTQMNSPLSIGLMVIGPLVGLLLVWLWSRQQQSSGPALLRRLAVASLVVLGAAVLLWATALALNTTPAADAVSSSANSWVLALTAMVLLYPANNVLNVLLPTLTAQRAPVRYLALLMATGFIMSRLGGVLGEALLTWWQGR
jgi:MFS family permease